MGATEAYITLDEAARLEGVSYETTKKRAQRGKLETRNETRESGGKDITLVKVNSLSKQARNAYREQERLKALAADGSDIQEEQKTEQPWYVDTDIDWYMEQYKERFYQAAELGNVVRQYLRETVGRYGDITAFAEEYAQKHLGKGYRTLYRMIKAYNEALFWQDKKEKEEGCSYEYFRVLCLCRKPKDVGKFPSMSAEVQQTIKNIWFDKDFAGNRGTKQMLYEQLEAICELKGWKKMPSYQTVARFISFLMEDEGMKNAHFLVANGTREYKNKVMCKRRRDTTSLQVMEMIQGDEHTFDCWVTYKAPNGNIVPIRPKLVCWIDTRSRMILGDVMCKDADSQTLKASLLKLIYHDAGSVPRYLYIDNGKDYTSKEMLGVDRKYRHDQAEKDKHFAVAFDDIHITVPRPSLPHVNVSYSTVGNGKATASVPNFSVSYYAKGAIMKKPTMFGMNGTSPMIGGEAGEEAIVPLDSLWNRMRNVVMNTFTMFFPGGKKQSDPTKEKNTVTQTKEKTEKQQTTTTKPEPKQAQPQGGTKYQTYHVTMNIDAQSIDDLRKLKKLLSELDGDNDPVTA